MNNLNTKLKKAATPPSSVCWKNGTNKMNFFSSRIFPLKISIEGSKKRESYGK